MFSIFLANWFATWFIITGLKAILSDKIRRSSHSEILIVVSIMIMVYVEVAKTACFCSANVPILVLSRFFHETENF